MKILQTNTFRKIVKKLHKNQKSDLDVAVKKMMEEPEIGDTKVGDLADVKVYKFKMAKGLVLLAYNYEQPTQTLTLLALGSHENFYSKLKR